MPSLKAPQVLLFGVVLALGFFLALFPFFPKQLEIDEGDIAKRDLVSPRDETFESTVLTEQARDLAALAVPDVLVTDPNVAQLQLDKLDVNASIISDIRQNDELDEAAKRQSLLALVSRDGTDTILVLSDERWQRIVVDAGQVLGAVLSGSIQPGGEELVREDLLLQIATDLTADEANVVADLASPLVVPTLVVDAQGTDAARDVARQSVEPRFQTVFRHDIIVTEGQLIDPTAVEILEEVGLLSPRVEWENLAAAGLIAALAALTLALYVRRFPIPGLVTNRNLVLLAIFIAVPVLIAKLHLSLVLPEDSPRFIAYFLPLAAAPMLISTLLGARLAIVVGLMQAALMMFAVISLPDLSLVETIQPVDVGRVFLAYGLGAVIGSYAVQRAERANQYAAAGVLVAAVMAGALFATWLLEPERSGIEVAWIIGAASVSGLGAGLLTAGGYVGAGALFGVTTRVQLMELAQLNSPLLRQLQDEAPGTFHHSIIVGNLAERAADLIGADPLLVRVGCYYHDLGKIAQPGYYIENQLAGDNPHDGMDPKESARIIAQHVTAGLELAERHKLPARVREFIPEHHGTRLVAYFYRLASQKDPNVDPSFFRYPGPKPQSRETAIVMLADSTEAMVRASEDRSAERIDVIVDEVVSERLAEGELEECDLTLRDITTISASFKQTLRGVYHPRIAYPEPSERERGARLGRFRPGRRVPPLPEAPAPYRSRPPSG